METYKWVFAPYMGGKGKGKCPSCGKGKSYTYYVDLDTGCLLGEEYGLCDRISSCGYSYSPYNNPPLRGNSGIVVPLVNKKELPIDTIPLEVFKKSFNNKFEDNLSKFLLARFKESRVKEILKRYRVGCSTLFGGNSTVFWNIGYTDKIVIYTGKIMKYTEEGKRDKLGGYPKIKWIHNFIKEDFNVKQVLFGEFLLDAYPDMAVKIVESEKTAIIMSIIDPNHLYLATGSMQNIQQEKLLKLKDRGATLIPDKGKAYEYWKTKIESYKMENIVVSNEVELDSELKEGDDIADKFL